MKRTLSAFLLLLFCTGVQAQSQARFVPLYASLVIEVNLGSLYKKANLEEIKKMPIFQEWERQSAQGLNDRYNGLKTLWNNPQETGIDLNNYAYQYAAFAGPDNEEGRATGFIMPVKDVVKLEDFLLNKIDIDMSNSRKIEKVGTMKMIDLGDQAILWGTDAALFITFPYTKSVPYPEYSYEASEKEYQKLEAAYQKKLNAWQKKYATILANSSVENSILKDIHFLELRKKGYDIGLYHTSSLGLSSIVNTLYTAWIYTLGLNPDGTATSATTSEEKEYGYTGITFNNGSISISSQTNYADSFAAKLEPITNTRFNTSLLRYVKSKECIALSTLSFNMAELKKLLNNRTDSLDHKIELEILMSIYKPELSKENKIVSINQEINDIESKLNEVYGYNGVDTVYAVAIDSTAAPEQTNEDEEYAVSYNEADYMLIDSLTTVKDSLTLFLKSEKQRLCLSYAKRDGLEADNLWDLFSGDFLWSADEITFETKTYKRENYDPETFEVTTEEKTDTVPYLRYTAVNRIKELDKLKTFLSILTKQGYLKFHNDHYTVQVPTDPKHEHFMYFSNGNLIITNNSNLAISNKDGYVDGSSNDPLLAAQCQNNNFLFRLNTDKVIAPIAKVSSSAKDKKSSSVFEQYLGIVEVDGGKPENGKTNGNTYIEFGKPSENSLLELFRFVNELYLIYQR